MSNTGKYRNKTGLIHRDISIDNLMFDENEQLKLIDFGAARNVELPENTITVSIKRGSSPEEQYRAKGEQGPWTDLYSLCGTMYFMLTGEIPEESVERVYADHLKPLQQKDDISLSMQEKSAIDKGMAVFAKDRYQNMEEFYNELYPDKNRVSSYNDIHLPKSFRDTLTQTGISGLFSQTATAMPVDESPVPTVTDLPVSEEPYVEIPNVIGKTLKKAKEKFQKMGIRIKVEKVDSSKKKGMVLQQSIAAGTQVKKESLITLTVSRGEKKAVQTPASTQAPIVTVRPKATKKPQKYDASLDGYLQ